MNEFHLAQLRHLYAQMITGQIKSQKSAAQDLLSPAIAHFEKTLLKS